MKNSTKLSSQRVVSSTTRIKTKMKVLTELYLQSKSSIQHNKD